ncbi:hypothetical protein ACHAPT_009640 [Fusarium lateritium]
MKPRRSIRSKSVPTAQSPRKSFLTSISRRFSLNAILRPSSQRLSDEEDRGGVQQQPQATIQEVKTSPPTPKDMADTFKQPESPTTASRISRRASRFWSASSANYFEDNTPAQASSPPGYEGTAYVPRHAAADFSKTASNRLTVMVEADETTLCSFNCAPNGNRITVIDDDEESEEGGASHHHQQALAALTARSRSISDGDRDGTNDYSLFLAQAAADQETRARRSAAAWAELEHRTTTHHRTSGADPLLSRQSRGQSAYLGVPGSVSGSSRPVSSIAISIAEYIRPSHVGRAW